MPKTTFKIRTKPWQFFNQLCKSISLKRDDFLSRALDLELDQLEKITPCDSIGEKWVHVYWLDELSLGYFRDTSTAEPVAINLAEDVIKSINSICASKRIPRDSFINIAIEFLCKRLYEPAKVISDPRTHDDFVYKALSQVYISEKQGEFDSSEFSFANEIRIEIADEFIKNNTTLIESLIENPYERLSMTKGDVERYLFTRDL